MAARDDFDPCRDDLMEVQLSRRRLLRALVAAGLV